MLMQADLQSQVAFHLTGSRRAGLEAVDPLALRPALLARYRDLTALRYDFPLVLVDASPDGESVQALSGVIDGCCKISPAATTPNGSRGTCCVWRGSSAACWPKAPKDRSGTLWDKAAKRLGVHDDESLRDSLGRARDALNVDGVLVDCNAALPARLLAHSWRGVQEAKAARFRDTVATLIQKLSDILRADFIRSDAGRSAESLKASIGDFDADLFDFGAMSRLLTQGRAGNATAG